MGNLVTEHKLVDFETGPTNFECRFHSRFLTAPISCRRILVCGYGVYYIKGDLARRELLKEGHSRLFLHQHGFWKALRTPRKGASVDNPPISLCLPVDISLRGTKSWDLGFLKEME